MNFSIDAQSAIEWVTKFITIYVVFDTIEKLYNFREFSNSGLYDWKFLREHADFSARSPKIRQLLDLFFEYRAWVFLLFLRGASAFYLLLFASANLIDTLCLATLFGIGSLANLRNAPYGAETENRFSLLIIGTLFLRNLSPTEFITGISLWFIALHSCLSYLTAGIVKLINSEWRSGNEIINIANSPNLMASQKAAVFFEKHRLTARILAWVSIAVECGFPLVLLIGKPWFILFLLWGISFHLANAVFLRFNKFFWVWIATYPAIFFAAQ